VKIIPCAPKPPLFIVGCPRSGTTLLQVLLDSHPNICIPPESHIFNRFGNILKYYGELEEHQSLKRLVKDLLSDERIKVWGLPITPDEFCRMIRSKNIHGVVELLFKLFAQREGKARWGDKTPQHMMWLDLIRCIFQEAQFVHVVRDGRDVAESMTRAFIGPMSIYGIALIWKEYVETFQEFMKIDPAQKAIEIHYEELVRCPEEELKRLLAFLGEEPIAEFGRDVPKTARRDNYIISDRHHASLEGRIKVEKIGVFKKTFSLRELQVFEAVAGDALKRYGYRRFGSGEKISFQEKIGFWRQDHYNRYARKILKKSGRVQIKSEMKEKSQYIFRSALRAGHYFVRKGLCIVK